MNTTYDQIYQTFLDNCMVEDINLPQTAEKQYQAIKNAVMYFNNRMRTNVECDDLTETVNQELSEDYILIIANYIRLVFLSNQKTYFETLFQPFQKDVGIKNFNSQMNSLKDSIAEQNKTIDTLIINTMEDFL